MSNLTAQEPVAPSANLSIADDELYEIIDGQRVLPPPKSVRAVWIASQILQHIGHFGRAHNVGHSICHALFRLPLPIDRQRRPAVAFVSYDRWTNGRRCHESGNPW